jgi:hypothetical protein
VLVATLAIVAPSCDGGDDDAIETTPPPPTPTQPAPEPPRPQRRAVVLSLDRESASPGQTLQLTIENRTRTRFEFGVAYRLERREGSRWQWVNRDAAFILILKFIEPGAREREEIRLPDHLEPGRYRIVKSFSMPERERELTRSVEFRVD